MIFKRRKSAIIFMAWGNEYVNEVSSCIDNSVMPKCDIFLITDKYTNINDERIVVIRAEFELEGLMRKAELIKYVPSGYDSYLFLDSDTRVIADISAGFSKAKKHGIALSPAPHYSLDWFYGFDEIMKSENVPATGQLQYNTGVIFFSLDSETRRVFNMWFQLGKRHANLIENDQPFLTLAMEMMEFNPYTLSIGYNYRGFGDAISGEVRVWHSHADMPADINTIESVWPPRRVINGCVHHTRVKEGNWYMVPPAWNNNAD